MNDINYLLWVWVQIKLRGYMSHIQQLCVGYWGVYSVKSGSVGMGGLLPSPRPQDASSAIGIGIDNQQPAEASGRSWVQSMFTRDTTTLRTNSSFTRVRKWTSDQGTMPSSLTCPTQVLCQPNCDSLLTICKLIIPPFTSTKL